MTTATIVDLQLQAVPNQSLNVNLNGQSCTIVIRSLNNQLYTDLYLGNTNIVYSQIANHGINVNQYQSDFIGYLTWYSDEGDSADSLTDYSLLGTTYHLYYANYNIQQVLYDNWVANNAITLNDLFNFGSKVIQTS